MSIHMCDMHACAVERYLQVAVMAPASDRN